MPLYAAAVVAAVALSYNNAGAVTDGLRALVFLNSFTDSIGCLINLSDGARFRLNLALPGRTPAFLFGIAAAWLVMHHGERIRVWMREKTWLRNGGADLLLLVSLFTLGLLLQKVTYRGFIGSAI